MQRLVVIGGVLTKLLIQGADRQTVWMHMCNVWWPGSVCWQQPVSVKCAETNVCVQLLASRQGWTLWDKAWFTGDRATIRCVENMVCVAFGGP